MRAIAQSPVFFGGRLVVVLPNCSEEKGEFFRISHEKEHPTRWIPMDFVVHGARKHLTRAQHPICPHAIVLV